MLDFKKSQPRLYNAKAEPAIVMVPKLRFLAVQGQGDPNDPAGAYAKALEALYAVAYTLRMSYKTDYQIPDFEPFVVPPLEGLWWLGEGDTVLIRTNLRWTSLIRIPDFIRPEDVDWAIRQASAKKKQDFSQVTTFDYDEGMVVQALHVGPYDDEPATILQMELMAARNSFVIDFQSERTHHEMYLSDPRRVPPEKLKTIIRLPIRRP